MRKVARAVIDIVGALSLIGMVLIAIIMTRSDYAQYRIGGIDMYFGKPNNSKEGE